MSDYIDYLAKISLFNNLPLQELQLLSQKLTSHTFCAGETVIQEFEESTALYILIDGAVNIVLETDGIEFVIEELESGQFFGEMALLDGKPRSAGVVCASDSTVLRLSSDDFYDILGTNPIILRALILELCDRLRKANEKIREAPNPQLTF